MTNKDMMLPSGKCCVDCVGFVRCTGLFSCNGNNTTCDWAPSRFRQRIVPIDEIIEGICEKIPEGLEIVLKWKMDVPVFVSSSQMAITQYCPMPMTRRLLSS